MVTGHSLFIFESFNSLLTAHLLLEKIKKSFESLDRHVIHVNVTSREKLFAAAAFFISVGDYWGAAQRFPIYSVISCDARF